jgi:hypothetical protein
MFINNLTQQNRAESSCFHNQRRSTLTLVITSPCSLLLSLAETFQGSFGTTKAQLDVD